MHFFCAVIKYHQAAFVRPDNNCRDTATVFFMQICLWHLHKKYCPPSPAALQQLFFNLSIMQSLLQNFNNVHSKAFALKLYSLIFIGLFLQKNF